MGIQRSSFYYWKKRLSDPAPKIKALADNVSLFREYHLKYPSHGYRWLSAKIRLDTGLKVSDAYAHKCCKIAGIKSESKHYRYKKPGEPRKVYPNLILAGLRIDGPMQCIVSDMTAFRLKGIYYELTLYMDLWNNEILSHSLSAKRGDRMTYISGLHDLTELKKQHPEYKTVLHSDQGSVYASKNYNELPNSTGKHMQLYNIYRLYVKKYNLSVQFLLTSAPRRGMPLTVPQRDVTLTDPTAAVS